MNRKLSPVKGDAIMRGHTALTLCLPISAYSLLVRFASSKRLRE